MDAELLTMPTDEVQRATLDELRGLRREISGEGGLRSQLVELRSEVRNAAIANKDWQVAHEERDDKRFDKLDEREEKREQERVDEQRRKDKIDDRAWSLRERLTLGILALISTVVTAGISAGLGASTAAQVLPQPPTSISP